MKTSVFGLLLLFCFSGSLRGQATPTASKTFDLQVGGGYVLDKGDYGTKDYRGGGVYATLDFTPHFGAEIDFHQANYPTNAMYERTYEVGGRYHRTYGRLAPYVKGMYGRGVFNFVYGGPDIVFNGTVVEHSGAVVANLAFNEFVFGGGADFAVLPWLNVRGDYEYQSWHSFPPDGLTPQLITIGVAYHFPGGLERGKHFR
jgi:hypothetical protein